MKKDVLEDDVGANITYGSGWATAWIDAYSPSFWGQTMQCVTRSCYIHHLLGLMERVAVGTVELTYKRRFGSGVSRYCFMLRMAFHYHQLGNAITLFGAVFNNHKTYTISLDGRPPQRFNGYALQYNAQTILVRPFPSSQICLVPTLRIVSCE